MQVRYEARQGRYNKFYVVTIRDGDNCTTFSVDTMSQVKKIRKQCRREAQSDLPAIVQRGKS